MKIPNTTEIKNFLLVGLPLKLIPKGWEEQLPGIKARKYGLWLYLLHQRLKCPQFASLRMRHALLHRLLRERLIELEMIKPGMSALCLGARTGGEVEAFLDMGCFAVGLDIKPVPAKRNFFVLYGDFHYLQFVNDSVDIVYTNSLDHSLRLGQVLSEIHRVLKPEGLFILEGAEGIAPSVYESCHWDSFSNLTKVINTNGFKQINQKAICDYKNQAVFRKCQTS